MALISPVTVASEADRDALDDWEQGDIVYVEEEGEAGRLTYNSGDGWVDLDVSLARVFQLLASPSYPTSDPGVGGQLYEDPITHVVMVSQG